MAARSSQLDLFTGEAAVGPAEATAEQRALAARLPAGIHLGTSSWSFPGWAGIVYDRAARPRELARDGLGAYAQHPLLRAVGLDRTYYAPLEEAVYHAYAAVVPEDFRFLVKAPELATLARFSRHPRHGAQAGERNPRYLDPAFADDTLLAPALAGLGDRLGAVVFQFPPQDTSEAGEGVRFAERLHAFLTKLSRGAQVAVEIRERTWLTPAYRAALRETGAVHCISVHPRMPEPEVQVQRACGPEDPALVVRWNLRGRQRYEEARERYAPFDRLREPDAPRRGSLAALCVDAARNERPAFVAINNKAEGSAPLSAFALARAIVDAG